MILSVRRLIFLFLFMFGLFSLSFLVSCNKESSNQNEVTITIEKPQNNQVVENSSDVEILINFSAPEIIHRITIKVANVNSPEILLFNHDQLIHKTQVTFSDQLDLSPYKPGDTFIMKVTACGDHDCSQIFESSVSFKL